MIVRGYEWGIGKLSELLRLSKDPETINKCIRKGLISPEMTMKELRDKIKELLSSWWIIYE